MLTNHKTAGGRGRFFFTAFVLAGFFVAPPLWSQTNGKTNRLDDETTPAQPEKPDAGKTVPPKKEEPAKPAKPGEPAKAGADHAKSDAPQPTFAYETNHFNLDLVEKKRLVDRIQWKMNFWTTYNYFNNADLRQLNEANQTSIDNTDDRMMFGLLGAELDTFFPVHPRMDLRLDVWRVGFWGHDQLGGRDTNNDARSSFNGANTLNFGLIYFDAHIFEAPTDADRLDIRVGRQDYRIGGEIDRDFFQRDVVDAIVVRWFSFLGKTNLMLIDWFAQGTNTQNVYFSQYVSFDNERVKGFNGDTNTFRSGITHAYSLFGDIDKKDTTYLGARAFYFFARYGAGNDGAADRTNNGTTGNFGDNDYVHMAGARLQAAYAETDAFYDGGRFGATYGMSRGKDRKRPNALFLTQDVDNNGLAFALEGEITFLDKSFILLASRFYAQGGAYYSDANQFSHGFVGFKADQVGGILTQLNWGMYPSAYTDDDGIDDLPYEISRKTGTDVIHLGGAAGWKDFLYFKIDWWRLRDTNRITILEGSGTTVDQNFMLTLIGPTFPTRTTQMAAARRFGAPLGEEVDVGVDWYITKDWKLWAVAGVFKPGRYFSTTGLKQGTPEGSTQFTGFQMGTKFSF